MKRCLFYLPLIGLGPVLSFLVGYLMGRGIMVGAFGSLLAVGCVYLGVPLFFGFKVRGSNLLRYFTCMGVLVLELALVAWAPGCMANPTSMGVAHRLKREFPIDQVRSCADQLLEKYRAKTLISADKGKSKADLWSTSYFEVDLSELPASLRERFRRVEIQRVETGLSKDLEVRFMINWERSIICDRRPFVNSDHLYSIEKGIHAYHNKRS